LAEKFPPIKIGSAARQFRRQHEKKRAKKTARWLANALHEV
jgi:hypothetical protein